jgi:hypothetical protein
MLKQQKWRWLFAGALGAMLLAIGFHYWPD